MRRLDGDGVFLALGENAVSFWGADREGKGSGGRAGGPRFVVLGNGGQSGDFIAGGIFESFADEFKRDGFHTRMNRGSGRYCALPAEESLGRVLSLRELGELGGVLRFDADFSFRFDVLVDCPSDEQDADRDDEDQEGFHRVSDNRL